MKYFNLLKIFKTITKPLGYIFFWRKFPREKRKLFIISTSFVVLPLLVLIVFTLINAKKSEAAWFDDSFQYRQRVDITNSGSAQTDFQVSITLDTAALITANKMQTSCNDIRVVDQTGKVLPHVIEEGSAACNTSTTKIWTKVASIPTTAMTLWIYYGNPNSANVENGNSVFAFYDNFNSGSLDTTKWSQTGASSISGGAITITTGSVYTTNTLNIDSRSYMYEYREKIATTQTSFTGLMVANASGTAGGNGNSNKLIYMMTNANTSIDMKGWAADGTAASYNLATNATLYTPTANTYYIDGFSMDTTQIKFWNNGSQTGSTVTGSWTANPYLWMGYLLGSNSTTSDMTDITVDWVRVRKYAATAPSVASPTNEEKGPAPIAYWKFDENNGVFANNSMATDITSGLAGYWKMDETSWTADCSTTSVKDSSGNGNDGKACANASAPSPTTGKFGNGGSFNGTTNYIDLSDPASLQPTSVTVSTWFKTTSSSGMILVRKRGNGYGLEVGSYSGITGEAAGTVTFWIHNGTTFVGAVSPSTYNDGNWHLATGTFDGGSVKLYVDSALVSTNNTQTTINYSADKVAIGRDGGANAGYFNGTIDDVRIYNRALTAGQAGMLYSGVSEGTLLGTTKPTWQQDSQCISSKCLYFDGTSSYLSVPNFPYSLGGTNNYTISGWVKRSGTSGTGTIISRYNGNVAGEWMVNMDQSTGILNAHREITPFSHNWTTAVGVGEWHHFAATYDGSNVRLYLDGRLDATVADTGSAGTAATTNVIIGAQLTSTAPANFFKGFIDDLKVYNYARSADQIKLEYNSKSNATTKGSGVSLGATDQSPLSNGQLAYWNMDEASWNGTSGEVLDSAGSGNNGTLNGQAGLSTTTPTSGTSSVITKTAAGWTVNAFTNFIVEITSGAGAPLGDNRAVTSNTATTITVSPVFSGSVGTRTFVVRQNWRGKFGNAGIYNGVNNFVAVANNVSGIKSVAFWVKPTSTTTSLIDLNGSAYITASSGTVSATGFTNPSIYVNGALNGTITANTWNHVVVTTTSSITGSAITIGKANSAFLSGQIDEVRLYNRTLSGGDANQIYNYAPPPVASWNFEEGQGVVAKDISGNGFNGSLRANGGSVPSYIPAKYGKGLKFNGTSNYVVVPASSTFDALQFTIEAWVNTSNLTQFGGIFEKTASNDLAGGSYQCRFNSNIQFQTLKTGGDFANYHSLTVTPLIAGAIANQWNHIACVYDGTTKSIYVNGKLAVTTGYTEIIQPTVNTGKVFIGSDGYSAGTTPEAPLNGSLDDVRFYNYARSAQQIVSDMNADHPAVGSPIASPLGYWKLDEGYGTKANSSGSIATMSGTLTGGAFWSNEGKFGKAVSFNGTSGYVDLGDQPQLYTKGPFTVSAWVSPGTSTAANQFIFSDFNPGGTTANFSLQLRDADRKFTFFYGDGSDAALSSTQATIGNWYHVVGVYDGTTNKIYINGVLEHTITQTQNRNTDAGGNAAIGKSGTPNVQWFRGKIDEVKYYNYALTADQVKIDMNRQSSQVLGALSDTSSLAGGSTASSSATAENCVPGDSTSCSSPIGKWNFEEGTGTTVNDTSGTGNTGTWSGTTGAQWTTGKIGKGGNFNGSNNRISVTDANSLDLSGNITFEAWINPTDFANDEMVILNKGTNDCGNYQFSIKTAKLAMPSSTKCAFDGTTVGSNSTVTAGVWQHVAAVVNGTTLTYYINGRLTDTISSWSLGVTNATNLYIGGPDPSQGVPAPDWFKGKIDQVQIFTYARSAAQIAWDYNRGAPVAWYKMDECQGTTIYDSSGNRNNGSLTTASSTITTAGTCTDGSSSSARYTGRNGKFNYGLNTDSGDFVTITNTTSTDLGANSYSASIWFKTTNNFSSSAGPLISKYSTGLDEAYPYNIYFNTSNQICFDSSDSLSTNNLCTTKTYNDGNWHNIIAIRNVSTTKVYIYIDGVQVASLTDATSGGSLVSGIDTLIGKATFGLTARYFVGQMDEARFYNYALTQIQIKTLYNNGAVQYAPITGTP